MTSLPTMIRDGSELLTGSAHDYDSLIDLVGDARYVLLGEATHGTHEFYRERAQITKRLINEKGFNAVAVEADWPHACRIHRFVRGLGDDSDAVDALGGFSRFPQWMWRNADVLDFVGWLRERNDDLDPSGVKCGFYGLDLYSLHASIDAVVAYLEKVDPNAAKRARRRYGCFDHVGKDTQSYGMATMLGLAPSCEQEVVSELVELRLKEMACLKSDGAIAPDAFFSAEQNAMVVRDAEQYYRTMYHSDFSSWNLRDTHMMESLVSLTEHLNACGSTPKVVVWAHNSHVGDALATSMHDRGELNLGQLVRQRFGKDSILIGFTTFHGTVTAATEWDAPAERIQLRPAMDGSVEHLFHESGLSRLWLNFENCRALAFNLNGPRLQRAVGVVYRPETELLSHYITVRLANQFDGVIHIDHTRAVEPLERASQWKIDEVEESYPTGL